MRVLSVGGTRDWCESMNIIRIDDLGEGADKDARLASLRRQLMKEITRQHRLVPASSRIVANAHDVDFGGRNWTISPCHERGRPETRLGTSYARQARGGMPAQAAHGRA